MRRSFVLATTLCVAVLVSPARGQEVRDAPGPLELQATAIGNTPLRATSSRLPTSPTEARALKADATIVFQLTIDASGKVAEIRNSANRLGIPKDTTADEATRRAVYRAFIDTAAAAVRQWQYERPARAPVTFPVALTFKSEGEVIASVVAAPTKVKHVDAVYVDLARRARVSGTVKLFALVGVDGKVAQVRVVESIPLLDATAIQAVQQWEYTPLKVDEMAMASGVAAIVTFPEP
jgi:TonB family protein